MTTPYTGTFPVGTDPLLIAPRVSVERTLLITNVGAVAAWLKFDNRVSQTSGYELAPGADLVASIRDAWYAVSSGAGTTLSIIDDTA